MAENTTLADLRAALNMAKMPDLGAVADAHVVIDVATFVNEIFLIVCHLFHSHPEA